MNMTEAEYFAALNAADAKAQRQSYLCGLVFTVAAAVLVFGYVGGFQ